MLVSNLTRLRVVGEGSGSLCIGHLLALFLSGVYIVQYTSPGAEGGGKSKGLEIGKEKKGEKREK